jgi:sulfite reductase alpha subunit-like flavoprotein
LDENKLTTPYSDILHSARILKTFGIFLSGKNDIDNIYTRETLLTLAKHNLKEISQNLLESHQNVRKSLVSKDNGAFGIELINTLTEHLEDEEALEKELLDILIELNHAHIQLRKIKEKEKLGSDELSIYSTNFTLLLDGIIEKEIVSKLGETQDKEM